MAEKRKVLGQLAPAAGVLTALYTVPLLTQVVVSSIVICNTGAAPTTFRVSIAIAGAVDNINQYVARDNLSGANSSIPLVLGVTLGATDVIKVSSVSGNVSFSAFGVEIT